MSRNFWVRTVLVAMLGFAASAFALATAADAGIVINIDKSRQRMTVMVDGYMKYKWPVSTGRPGYATPSGTFWTFRMEKDYRSKEWDDAPMPNTIFFTPKGHAIHGTLQTGSLGSPVSHGCVRLSPENAATLFKLVRAKGLWSTKVVITGPSPKGPKAPARVATGKRPAGVAVDTSITDWLN